MGAKVQFLPATKIIQVTEPPNVSGTVTIDIQTDIYSDGKEDWQTTGTLSGMLFPITPIGGNAITDTVSLDATFILVNGWRIRPYEGDHFFDLQGNIYTEEQEPPVVATTGSWNVLTLGFNSAIVRAVNAGNTTITASVDVNAIADAVWEAQLLDYVSSTGSMAEKLIGISKDVIFVK